MNEIKQEFKQYLIENYGLDKKDELIEYAFNKSGATIEFSRRYTVKINGHSIYDNTVEHDLDSCVHDAIVNDMPDKEFDYFYKCLSKETYVNILFQHIKIFELDEYVKQHVKRMVL